MLDHPTCGQLPTLIKHTFNSKGAEISFTGKDIRSVAALLEYFFLGQGYHLGRGTKEAGAYEKGGGLVSRRKYAFSVTQGENGVHANLASAVSGVTTSGVLLSPGFGLTGVVREQAARGQFNQKLATFLTGLENPTPPPVPSPPAVHTHNATP